VGAFFDNQENLYATSQEKVEYVSTYYPHEIFLTKDNGTNWATIDTVATNPGQVEASVFRRDNRGTIYTGNRNLKIIDGGFDYSTDDGQNWVHVRTFIEGKYDYRAPFSALLTSDSSLFITTYNSGIFKSVDGGTTWKKVYNSFVTLAFLHEDIATGNLYAASASALLKSVDKGETWVVMENDPWMALNIKEFYLSANGTFYISGNAGVIKSKNGTSWESMWDSGTSKLGISDMDLSNNFIYVVASDSSIYRLTKAENATSSTDIVDNAAFSIYPNPASNQISVNLSFSDHQSKIRELTIVDISGKTVIKEELTKAIYTQTVDISALERGMYFVLLQVDSKRFTQKLIVR
jgi:photosystem II stability/assembly factor-like uncharacterized protein